MNESIAEAHRSFFLENGYFGPLKFFSEEEMRNLVAKLEVDGNLRGGWPENLHLKDELVRNLFCSQKIGDLVSEVSGEDNILLFRSVIFIQKNDQGAEFGWHQDIFKDVLENESCVGIHIALTSSFEESCCSILPGSHKYNDKELEKRFQLKNPRDSGMGNFFFSGQEDEPGKKMILKPGQGFIFHARLVHRTWLEKGDSNEGRIAIGLRTAPAWTKVRKSDPCVILKGAGSAMVHDFE
jgi:ectoine hydroxylase-related dioxygenase (phytanoyl-CoA dioxygenase family)